MANPTLPDFQTMVQMGLDPKTGLPLKMTGTSCNLKPEIKKFLRVCDELDAVNRYKWGNLPKKLDITSQELERLVYYRGQLIMFYMKSLDKYYIMPFALEGGGLDFYGRFKQVHPIPFANGKDDEKSARYKTQMSILSTLKLNVLYKLPEEPITNPEDYCVIIRDYTNQLPQSIIPRQELNEALLDVMSECVPYMRTSLINSTGTRGVRVRDADQYAEVIEGAKGMQRAAETGLTMVPMQGNVEFQDLTSGKVAEAAEFMSAMKSLDNLRLSGYGIENGGIYEKKAHELNAEAEINEGSTNARLQDGLKIRQNFVEIANALWGESMTVDIAEEHKPQEEQPLTEEGQAPKGANENANANV